MERTEYGVSLELGNARFKSKQGLAIDCLNLVGVVVDGVFSTLVVGVCCAEYQ